MKTKITNVRHDEYGRWKWEVNGKGYATNRAGNGIFKEDKYGFYNQQIAGTCQFTACKTISGMRRKLKNWFCIDETF